MPDSHADTITIEQSFATAVTPSPNVLQTASMFGLGVDTARELAVVPPTQIPLPRPGVIFITGPSGSGKSTILRLIAQQARVASSVPQRVIDFDELSIKTIPDRPLVDVFRLSLEQATTLLAKAGLGDAFVMLRSPSELSDGQRYRLRLAMAMVRAESRDQSGEGGERSSLLMNSARHSIGRRRRSSPATSVPGRAAPAARSLRQQRMMICSKRSSQTCSSSKDSVKQSRWWSDERNRAPEYRL